MCVCVYIYIYIYIYIFLIVCFKEFRIATKKLYIFVNSMGFALCQFLLGHFTIIVVMSETAKSSPLKSKFSTSENTGYQTTMTDLGPMATECF